MVPVSRGTVVAKASGKEVREPATRFLMIGGPSVRKGFLLTRSSLITGRTRSGTRVENVLLTKNLEIDPTTTSVTIGGTRPVKALLTRYLVREPAATSVTIGDKSVND